MKEFFIQYWHIIVVVVADIVGLVIALCLRKRKITPDAIKNIIASCLPYYINLAEVSCRDGRTKLCFVVDEVLSRIKRYVSSIDEQYWITYIQECVEKILTTPQKKVEVKDNG